MLLSALMAGTGALGDLGADPEIALVTGDSRLVVPGALFFALPGAAQDGHAFAGEAARRGAVAVVAERPVDCAPALLLLAPSSRRPPRSTRLISFLIRDQLSKANYSAFEHRN